MTDPSGQTAAADLGAAPEFDRMSVPPPAMTYKVLIVEDSKASRELIASAAEAVQGVEAFTTGTGFEALKLLSRQRFDLIITDINMPGINGLELINFVKRNPSYRDTPLFVITTEGREQDRKKGLALGAVEYLVKPFRPQDLEGLLMRYLHIA